MKPLYTTVKNANNIDKIGTINQIRLLFGQVSNDEVIKLEASEKVSRENIQMESALNNLVVEVTSKMKELGKKSVTVSISSRFKPYFKSVFDTKYGKGRFYDFIVEDKGATVLGADYFILVKIKEKED